MKSVLLSTCIFLSFHCTFAQFGSPQRMSDYSRGEFVMDDLNGDGLDDMVTVQSGIRVFLNNGDDHLSYSQAINYFTSGVFFHAELDDMNADGKSDLIISVQNSMGDWVLELYLNAGNGLFDYHSSLPIGSFCYAIKLADINNDGLQDIVYGGNGINGIFYQQELLQFEGEELVFEGSKIIRFVSDIDTDGDFDLVTEGNGVVDYYENNDGNFATTSALMTINGTKISLGDTDLDGDDDLMYVTVNSWIARFENLGNLQFAASSTMAQVGDYISDFKLADKDADGDMDILVELDYDAQTSFRIYTNVADYFILDANISMPENSSFNVYVNSAYLNDDAWPDIVVLPMYSTCYAYFGNPDQTYEELEIVNYGVEEFVGWISADLNTDGYEELIVSSAIMDDNTYENEWHETSIFQMNSAGEINNRIPLLEIQESNWGFLPYGSADFNGDGATDILGWRSGTMPLYAIPIVLIQDSAMHFEPLQPDLSAFEQQNWRYNYFFDFDSDGDMDIVSHAENIAVMLNNGNGELGAPSGVSTGAGTGYEDMLFYEDFNGDGIKDILTSSFGEGIVVISGTGNSQFSSPIVIFENSSQPYYNLPNVVDYDADGDRDFLFVFQYFDSQQFEIIYKLIVLENLGNGTWSNHLMSENTTEYNIDGIVLLDLTEDGRPEIITRSQAGLVWYENNDYSLDIYHSIDTEVSSISSIALARINSDITRDLVHFTNRSFTWYPNLIGATSKITGLVYWDENENGQREYNEQIMQGVEIFLDQTPASSITNEVGEYDMYLFDGEYNLTIDVPQYWELTSTETYNIVVNTGEYYSDTLDFGLKPLVQILDLDADYTIVSNVCNTTTSHLIQVANYGTYSENMFADIVVDSIYSVLNSEPLSDSIVGNHYYFHLDSLSPFLPQTIELTVLNPPAQIFGTSTLCSVLVCEEGGILCTMDFTENPVLCAYDPNDKQVYPVGLEAEHYTLNSDTLEYTIRFQNTGNYPARDVRIEDQLDVHLDWNSLKFISASHPIAAVSVDENGKAIFKFNEIWLPDSIADEPGSHGFVKFSILPKQAVVVGTRIENTAEIYFDLNEAIITNTTWSTLCSASQPLTVVELIDNNAILSTSFSGSDYQWYLEDAMMTGSDSSSVVANYTGHYQVRVIDQQGCKFESEKTYAISKNDRAYSVTIGPNPTRDVINMTVTAIDLSRAKARIYNNLGELTGEYSLNSNAIGLDVSQFATGVYFIRIFDGTKWVDGVEKVTIVD